MKTILLVILKALTQSTSIIELLSFSDHNFYKNPIHMWFVHLSVLFQMHFGLHLRRRRLIRTAEDHRLTFILMAIWGSPARLVLTAETEQHTRIKKQSHDLAPCAKKRVICIRVKDLTAQHKYTTEKMLKQLTRLATSRPPPFKMIK